MTRRATIRTAHADPETVAAAVAPDNTDEMETRVETVADDDTAASDAGERVVVTTIERDATSGLQATVDDTLVNLAVADRVAANARGETNANTSVAVETSTTSDSSTATDTPPTTDAASAAETESTADQPTKDTNDTL